MDLSFKHVVRGFCKWWLGSVSVCAGLLVIFSLVKLILFWFRERAYQRASDNYIVDDVIATVRDINQEAEGKVRWHT